MKKLPVRPKKRKKIKGMTLLEILARLEHKARLMGERTLGNG